MRPLHLHEESKGLAIEISDPQQNMHKGESLSTASEFTSLISFGSILVIANSFYCFIGSSSLASSFKLFISKSILILAFSLFSCYLPPLLALLNLIVFYGD